MIYQLLDHRVVVKRRFALIACYAWNIRERPSHYVIVGAWEKIRLTDRYLATCKAWDTEFGNFGVRSSHPRARFSNLFAASRRFKAICTARARRFSKPKSASR